MAEFTDVIRVAADSRSTGVAGAIAGALRERPTVELQAIGAGAVNQAIKAITLARGYLEEDHYNLSITPSFVEVSIEGIDRTVVLLTVARQAYGESHRYEVGDVVAEVFDSLAVG